MPKVFISHATADGGFVEREIIAPLRQAGIETWYSQEDIRPKDFWEDVIVKALEDCDWFLLAMSPRAEQSEWVRSELSWAMKYRFDRIVPVLIEMCKPYKIHLHVDRMQHIDFRRDRAQAKTALIRTFLGVSPPPPVPQPIAPQPARTPPPPALSPVAPALLDEWISPFSGMKFALVPDGWFDMGSEDGDSDEKPRRRVTISQPFYMGVHEVTQGEYQRVMGKNPSHFKGADSLPVESVSWFDAVKFCNALSEKEGLAPFYKIGAADQVTVPDWNATGYRLPTEAEWEHACRAGSTTRYSFGDDAAKLGEYAWYGNNSDGKTHPVGQKLANAFSLHDMHGNAWEWCWDWYGEDYYKKSSSNVDPKGPESGDARVLRGGCWLYVATCLRSAYRDWRTPTYRGNNVGLRLARTYH